jgi:Leucine-rich repeat (LRR) protein
MEKLKRLMFVLMAILAIILMWTGCSPPAETTVITTPGKDFIFLFPDSQLATIIYEKLENPEGLVNVDDLKLITEINASNMGIKNLKGLEYLTNLTSLDLSNNSITDITPLSNLIKLTNLDISFNPDLTTDPDGDGPKVSANIKPLEKLTALVYLNLSYLTGLNTSYLANLKALEEINLAETGITDVEFATNLTNLIFIDLQYCKVQDLSPFLSNPGINAEDTINLQGNPLDGFVDDDVQTAYNTHIDELRGKNVIVLPEPLN